MLFKHGSVAHLGERLICIQEVEGSIPFRSTILFGWVAQLARAIGSYPVGRRFESAPSYQMIKIIGANPIFLLPNGGYEVVQTCKSCEFIAFCYYSLTEAYEITIILVRELI